MGRSAPVPRTRTVREGVRHGNPVASQLLERPELVDAVQNALWAVDQAAAQLLQVAQDCDVTVRLHRGGGHPHEHHIGESGERLLVQLQACNRRTRVSSVLAAGQSRQETCFQPTPQD